MILISKPGIQRVQALVIAMKPVHRLQIRPILNN